MNQAVYRHLKSTALLTSLLIAGVGWSAPSSAPYSAVDYYRCSRDTNIVQALQILDTSSDHAVVVDIMNRNVKIVFKDMRELGKAYLNHDALSFLTPNNEQMIYINMKHANAPAPALAAVIGHEVIHSDRENSMAEEVYAWNREGMIWEEMLQRYPVLRTVPTGRVPLVDRENAIVTLIAHARLRDEIINNVAYQGLPQHSPGY